MRQSYAFIAAVTLVSTTLLILFGIATIGPLLHPAATNQTEGTAVTALTAPTVDFGNPTRGAAQPRLTVVDYGDYSCTACASMDADMRTLLAAYPQTVRMVWKDFPNDAEHPDAEAAAEAARCAGLQGAFWNYHDALMANVGSTGRNNYLTLAGQLGLDTQGFGTCLDSASTKPIVQRDLEEALRLQLDAAPTLFIGQRRISGAIGYDQLKAYVDAALAK